ncbi:MAG: hypothetical protein IJV00_00375 [Clostridia bacterium]|nr:hypothetical protein [Clostridia bacterium]
MTEIYFCFDTEDFTSPKAWDACVEEAELLRKYGVRGNFNVVGYLAREWIRNGRMDVPEALKHHDVGFHSLRHSYHPTICEYTDLENYEEAKKLLLEYECEGIGMVKAATGKQSFEFACPPGISTSYVAMYEYARMGIPLYIGSVFEFKDGRSVHFCNALHTNYDFYIENLFYEDRFFKWRGEKIPYDPKTFLDHIASMKRVILATHPTRAYHSTFWDLVNYNGENKHPMYEWEPTPLNPPETTKLFFDEFETLIRALQADGRFEIKHMDQLAAKVRAQNAARVIKKSDLASVRDQLREKFWQVRLESGTYSISDCFAAASHFCLSDEPFYPCPVRGFLETPLGASTPVTLTADEVRRLAAAFRPDAFLPSHYRAGAKGIGPADLLFAMLDVALGADSVSVIPRPQMPSLEGDYAILYRLNMKGKHWVHRPDFADDFITERLRLQSWTLRDEA